MKLSEIIAKVGDDNVEFQNLDDAMTRLQVKTAGRTIITFGTMATTTVNGTEKLGLVVWLDRSAVKKAIGDGK